MNLTHLGLFEGIGGFSLAAHQMGWNTVATCEIDEWCNRLLDFYFPNSDRLTDITTTDFSKYYGKIDVLTGGFPCQPFSVSGKRKGTSDPRFLWKEMLRAIKQVRPRYIVAENVLGLVSWNAGEVLDMVCNDLEDADYQTQTMVLPASSFGAPHERKRVYIVAQDTSSFRFLHSQPEEDGAEVRELRKPEPRDTDRLHLQEEALSANAIATCCAMWYVHDHSGITDVQRDIYSEFPRFAPVLRRDDGLSSLVDGSPIQDKQWVEHSIKAFGNAICPPVVIEIYKTFEALELYYANS